MTVTDTPVLACGHKPTQTTGTGTGYGTWIPSGEKLCYRCLDDRQRQHIANGAAMFVGYVNADNEVTTWSGGKLGRVFSVRRGPVRRTGYCMTYVHAVVADGSKYYGQYNADSGNAVVFRRLK